MNACSRYPRIVTQEFGASVKHSAVPPVPQLQKLKESLAKFGLTSELARKSEQLRKVLAGNEPSSGDFQAIHDYLRSRLSMVNLVEIVACLQEHHPQFVPLLYVPKRDHRLARLMQATAVAPAPAARCGAIVASLVIRFMRVPLIPATIGIEYAKR